MISQAVHLDRTPIYCRTIAEVAQDIAIAIVANPFFVIFCGSQTIPVIGTGIKAAIGIHPGQAVQLVVFLIVELGLIQPANVDPHAADVSIVQGTVFSIGQEAGMPWEWIFSIDGRIITTEIIQLESNRIVIRPEEIPRKFLIST
jgi:hypothetical protein